MNQDDGSAAATLARWGRSVGFFAKRSSRDVGLPGRKTETTDFVARASAGRVVAGNE